MNKVTRKKDIITSFLLTSYFEDEEYPIDLMDITYEISRNNSELKELDIKTVENIINTFLHEIRGLNILGKSMATISFELEYGYLPGEHLFNIRLVICGTDISKYSKSIEKAIESTRISSLGGYLSFNSKKVDKTGLHIELIPLQLDIQPFLKAREENIKDKRWYKDEVIKLPLSDFKVLSYEDIIDPLYEFKVDKN